MFVVGFDERINVLLELFDGGVRCAGQRLVLIALMGFVTALIWLTRLRSWEGIKTADGKTATALATLFAMAWLVTFVTHLYLGATTGFMKAS